MKKLLTVMCILALTASLAGAQNKNGNGKDEWREKARAEQAAMITQELDLTEAEAQAFWPVYNDVQKTRREAFGKMQQSYKALRKGVKSGEGDVNALLDAYMADKAACDQLQAKALPRYKKVLPAEKVAKLVIAEEKFRHNQIGHRERSRD